RSGVGLVGPAHTPPEIIDTLHRDIMKPIKTTCFHERMAAIGVDVAGTTPAAFGQIVSDDYEQRAKAATAAGTKPQPRARGAGGAPACGRAFRPPPLVLCPCGAPRRGGPLAEGSQGQVLLRRMAGVGAPLFGDELWVAPAVAGDAELHPFLVQDLLRPDSM